MFNNTQQKFCLGRARPMTGEGVPLLSPIELPCIEGGYITGPQATAGYFTRQHTQQHVKNVAGSVMIVLLQIHCNSLLSAETIM